MANETSHAAWLNEKRFSVRLLPEEEPPTELVSGIAEFLDAVDFAVDWLAREDPERTGTASLAIFETCGGESEKVWAYPPDEPRDGEPLLKIFGFDPVNWKSAASEFVPREPATGTFFPRAAAEPAPPRVAAEPAPRALPRPPQPTPVPVAPLALLRPPQPAPVPAEEYTQPAPSHTQFEPRRALAAAWADRVSRSCLILAGVSLWLLLALNDVSVLLLLFVALSGLWWRRDKLVGTAEADVDDWL